MFVILYSPYYNPVKLALLHPFFWMLREFSLSYLAHVTVQGFELYSGINITCFQILFFHYYMTFFLKKVLILSPRT